MDKNTKIDTLKERHNDLYIEALDKGLTLLKTEGRKDEIMDLIRDIVTLSANPITIDNYRWLSDVAGKWQSALSSKLNIPMTIKIAKPSRNLFPKLPPGKALTNDEIEYWITRNAEVFGLGRKARIFRDSSKEEEAWDKQMAEVYFISDVLDGKINFASRIAYTSYELIERIWLKDVKLLRAYMTWQKRGGGVDHTCEIDDYLETGNHSREMLVNSGIKALPTEFGEAKAYIEKKYLTDGKIDTKNNHEAWSLVERKAKRIDDTNKLYKEPPERHDSNMNWFNAEHYVKMFYENIIDAVIKDEEEKVLTVLKAFQYSKAKENGWWIINSFEAALAIYFLNPIRIETLWKKAVDKPKPTSSVETEEKVQSWPEEIIVPKECEDKFVATGETIMYNGVMTELIMNTLLEQLNNEEQKKAVKRLFDKSRLIHKETTL